MYSTAPINKNGRFFFLERKKYLEPFSSVVLRTMEFRPANFLVSYKL